MSPFHFCSLAEGGYQHDLVADIQVVCHVYNLLGSLNVVPRCNCRSRILLVLSKEGLRTSHLAATTHSEEGCRAGLQTACCAGRVLLHGRGLGCGARARVAARPGCGRLPPQCKMQSRLAHRVLRRWSTASRGRARMRRPRPRRCAAWMRPSTTAAARSSTAATLRCLPAVTRCAVSMPCSWLPGGLGTCAWILGRVEVERGAARIAVRCS